MTEYLPCRHLKVRNCGIPAGRWARACWLGIVSERTPYKTDLTDEQWELSEPAITAWKARHRSVSGYQGRYEMREIVNALLYQGRTGCHWDLLRWQVREKARRKANPSQSSGPQARPGR